MKRKGSGWRRMRREMRASGKPRVTYASERERKWRGKRRAKSTNLLRCGRSC